jgi:trans-aconitate 2-methyltransferase
VTYAFGHSPTAAGRLELLNAVFAGTTDALLDRAAPAEPRHVLDLGCGPGVTTRRLVARFPTARVVAVDLSPEFVDIARTRLGGQASVDVADVTSDDLDPGPFDLIATRFLVTHLGDPTAALAQWVRRLAPGGVLLVEETASIVSDDPVLAAYLELAGAVLGARGHDMYIGRRLADLVRDADGSSATDAPVARVEVVEAPLVPTVGEAARLFAMNLTTLRHDPVAVAGWPSTDLEGLHEGLVGRSGRADRGPIRWSIGQLALTR